MWPVQPRMRQFSVLIRLLIRFARESLRRSFHVTSSIEVSFSQLRVPYQIDLLCQSVSSFPNPLSKKVYISKIIRNIF